jgi:ribonuclease Z
MKVIPLGTSSGTPTKERNVSSVAIVLDGRWLLFDCGEGTQYRILRAPFRLGQLEVICVTHLHGDHLYGLPGLLGTLSLQHREQPLFIYGPRGIRDFINAVMRFSYLRLDYELKITEVEPGTIRDGEGYSIKCLPLDHRVTTFGYTIIEDDRPGRFDVERAKVLGIPSGPLYRQLQMGEDVTLSDGRMIRSAEVVGEKRKGRRVAYCTDTRPCPNGVELARNASMLIHEATYTEDLTQEASARGHSTAAQAASVAQQAETKRLLITHFSPRYLDTGVLLSEARRIFPATEAARDLAEFEIKAET